MATAIDFKALLEEEKRKALAEMGRESCAVQDLGGPAVSLGSTQSEKDGAVLWQDLPDPEVELATRQPIDLARYAVGQERVGGIAYIPDFLSVEEGHALISRIDAMPPSSWTNLKRRRLQNHGGTPHPDGMIPERVPQFIDSVMNAIVQAGIFTSDQRPNHVLLNEYKAGQGIMPHQDGPLYLPIVAILSLAGPALLQFWDSLQGTKSGEGIASVLCQPNSLLVFSGDAYQTHWHGIREDERDLISERTVNLDSLAGTDVGSCVERGLKRLSLTVRMVLKVKDEDSRIMTQEAMQEEQRKSQWWLASRGEEGKVYD